VTCECQDFPRIQFCKHIAAVHVHFPHLCADLHTQNKVSQSLHASRNPQDISTQQHAENLTKDITGLSKTWATLQHTPLNASPATVEILRSTKYSFEAAIASVQGSSALPDKLPLAPNQNSWTETAERMGAKRAPKWKSRDTEPKERALNAHSIGVVKGGRRRVHNDPYSGGQHSGKRAKSDALSPEANIRARAEATQSASVRAFPSTAPDMAPPHFATRAVAPPLTQPPPFAPPPPFVQPLFAPLPFAPPPPFMPPPPFTQPLPT
jgi:hypothetical protein